MKRNLAPRLVFSSWFALTVFCAAAETNGGLSHAAVTNETMSATINSVRRESNTVQIAFQVTGNPDFVHVESAPAVDGIYRVEQAAELTISPGVMRAFVPVSTNDSFFRVRLISQAETNTLLIPREAQMFFGGGFANLFDGSTFQQVYAAVEFADAPTDVVEIKGIAFRLDEDSSDMNAFVSGLTVRMEVFRGKMSELPENGVIFMGNAPTVLDQSNVRLTAPMGRPSNAFDVRLTFDTPFIYDRRLGQLTLDVSGSGASRLRSFDSSFLTADRGWQLYLPGLRPNIYIMRL